MPTAPAFTDRRRADRRLPATAARWSLALGVATAALAPLAVAPSASAAPSAASTLTRLKSMLGRAAKDLEKIEERLPQQMIPVNLNAVERSFEALAKLFGEMDEKLASVPAGEAGRDEVAAEIAAAKARRDELSKRFAAARSSGDERLKALEAEAPTATPAAERLDSQLRQIDQASQGGEGDLETVRRHKDIAAEAEAMIAKYSDIRPNGAQPLPVRELLLAVNGVSKRLASYKDGALPRNLADAPAALQAQAAQLQAQVEAAQKQKKFSDFHSAIPAGIAALRQRAAVYEALGQDLPGYKPEAASAARAAADAAEQAGGALKAEIIAANVPRPDVYKGEGGDALRALAKKGWTDAYTQHKVVRVALQTEDWDRRKGWEYDNGRRAWGFHDISFIQVDVYVASEDGKSAYRYFGRLIKDNVAGSGPKMLTEMVTYPPKAPAAIFPMARVK